MRVSVQVGAQFLLGTSHTQNLLGQLLQLDLRELVEAGFWAGGVERQSSPADQL